MMATPARTRGKYRKYLRDSSAPIPRSTLWRLQKTAKYRTADTVSLQGDSPPKSPRSLQGDSPPESPRSLQGDSPPESPCRRYPTIQPSNSSLADLTLLEPLYHESKVSTIGACCAIMEFCTSSKLPDASIEKLHGLLHLLCPDTNNLPSSLYKSSRQSLWPVNIAVANLPPNQRMNKNNILLSTLWVGPGKPNMEVLLKPILEAVNKIYVSGLPLSTPAGPVIVRCKLLFGIFDMVARAPVLSMNQFNGAYGCHAWEHPSTQLGRGVRVYLPSTAAAMRTNETVLAAAKTAEKNYSVTIGIKSASVLTGSIDLVQGIPVDYMHAALEGVSKYLMTAWFDSKHHGKPYCIRHCCGQTPSRTASTP